MNWTVYDPVYRRNIVAFDQYEKAYEFAVKLLDKHKGIKFLTVVCQTLEMKQKVINNLFKPHSWEDFKQLDKSNLIAEYFIINSAGNTIYYIKQKRKK